MKRLTPALLLLMLAAGCAQQKGGPMPTHYEDALSQLNSATASKPGTKQSEAVSQALLPPLVVEMPRAEGKPGEARFDLSVNNAPAPEVFMAIASGSPYSMIVHPSIKEKLSIKLNNTTVFEALDTLREMYGYEYKVQGNRILIQPVTLQTRIFQVSYLYNTRKGKSELRVASSSPSDSAPSAQAGVVAGVNGPQGPVVQALAASKVETTSDLNFWTDLTSALRAIIGTGEGRNMVINAESGVVVVRAMPSELREVGEFLRTMQNVVSRQVLLEAKIIDVQLSDSFETGINWAAFHAGTNSRFAGGIQQPATSLSTQGAMSTFTSIGPDGKPDLNSLFTSTPGSPGSVITGAGVPGTLFGLAFQTSNFAALINFLQSQGEVQVLSSPRIAAINNQKAVLKVGTDQFFVTNVTTNQTTTVGGFVQNSPTITTQPFFSGVSLDITPQIDENNQIILHVHPAVSNVVNQNTNINLGQAGIFTLPLAASTISETDTVVRVTNSNIVAIGGLMKQQDQRTRGGVPGLMDIPIIGSLFKNTSRSGQKSELVILIKPTVIENEDSWRPSVQEAANRIRDWQHDEFGRYWNEEVVRSGSSAPNQPNAGKQ